MTWIDPDKLEKGDPAFEVEADLSVVDSPASIGFPVLGMEPLGVGERIYVLVSTQTKTPTMAVDATAYFVSTLPWPPAADLDGGPLPSLARQATDGSVRCATAPVGARNKATDGRIRAWLVDASLQAFLGAAAGI